MIELRKLAPNLFPTIPAPYRIAFIGEAPGADEEAQGEPFVGQSGRLLDALCSHAGLVRQSLFLGNVCQYRPADNDISQFKWDGLEITEGLARLREDLTKFQPNLCVLLGNTPLKAFFGHENITYWRGSVRRSAEWGYKCLPTYHPAAILYRESKPEWKQILAFDIRKAAMEGLTKDLKLPERFFRLPEHPNYAHQVAAWLCNAWQDKLPLSIDIEGGCTGMSCLSIATSPEHSYIIPFSTTDGLSFFTEEEEENIWVCLSRVLCDPTTPKILQNSLYDNFVLSYTYNTHICGVVDDTMFKHWEAYCELPKSLGFQASIYTNQPPWKEDIDAPDLHTFWRYCCTDSAVTYEINSVLDSELDLPASLSHYHFNLNLLHPLLYMELRGIRFNTTLAQSKGDRILKEVEELQEQIAKYNGGEELNVKSTKQKKEFLYTTLGLPEQFNRKTRAVTTNDEAILSLYKKTNHPALGLLLTCIRKRTNWSSLQMTTDPDGRVRCSYNQLSLKDDTKGGPPTTGRLSCSTSITGSGGNLQTITEHDRDCFQADEGCWMGQCDLSGADAWTVAAHCASLGDPTMLDDLKAGIKVAKVIAGMFLYGPEITRLNREELRQKTEGIKKDDPIYFGSKCCQHGTNYGMGKVLLSQTIFLQSEGKINISAADAQRLQDLYLLRYPGVKLWHRWCEQQLKNTGRLTSASGNTRIFFGRRDEHDTLKRFLAHEPQNNTTHATNMAALRLWTDPANRWGFWSPATSPALTSRTECLQLRSPEHHPDALIIEPLHQVHDALLTQWPKETTPWSLIRLREYFNNSITISGITLVIPFDGSYGATWGTLTEGKI